MMKKRMILALCILLLPLFGALRAEGAGDPVAAAGRIEDGTAILWAVGPETGMNVTAVAAARDGSGKTVECRIENTELSAQGTVLRFEPEHPEADWLICWLDEELRPLCRETVLTAGGPEAAVGSASAAPEESCLLSAAVFGRAPLTVCVEYEEDALLLTDVTAETCTEGGQMSIPGELASGCRLELSDPAGAVLRLRFTVRRTAKPGEHPVTVTCFSRDASAAAAGTVTALDYALPEYLETELEEVEDRIREQAEPGSVVFAVHTDLHFSASTGTTADVKNNLLKAMRRIANDGLLDFTVNLGDLYDGKTIANDTEIIRRAMEYTQGQICPNLMLSGDHDNSQSDGHIYLSDFLAMTMPYYRDEVVLPSDPDMAETGFYYYDVPEPDASGIRTRIVVLNNGYLSSGATAKAVFRWLTDEVFTEDVSSGWQFTILCHIPVDPETYLGYNRLRGGSVDRMKANFLPYFDAVNAASAWSFRTEKTATAYYGEDGVLTGDPSDTEYAYTLSGSACTAEADFSGWTSKVRLIVSGHVHCDRFGTVSAGETKDYVIAYTACGSRTNTKTAADFYVPVYGPEGAVCEWTDTMRAARPEGTAEEDCFDVYILNSSGVKRIRFGAGQDRSVSFPPE